MAEVSFTSQELIPVVSFPNKALPVLNMGRLSDSLKRNKVIKCPQNGSQKGARQTGRETHRETEIGREN